MVDDDAKIDFVSKDVQFIASGNLLTETVDNKYHLKIARDEKADHLIICYVGRNIAYVFIHSEIGLGGLPFNFQHCKALSSIHNPISAHVLSGIAKMWTSSRYLSLVTMMPRN